MSKNDLYEALLEGYEFMLGRLPNREQFKEALKQTISEADIRVILLLPMRGAISMSEFEKRAAKIGISAAKLHAIVRRLVPEGFILSYLAPEETNDGSIVYPTPAPLRNMRHKGRVVQRGDVLILCELQVRKKEDDPMRRAATVWMDAMTRDAGQSIPTKTAYFRVIPYEGAVTPSPDTVRIPVGVKVPDPREILPFDVVSEMVCKEPIIALADCYCRSTQAHLGNACDHPLETCLYFNTLAVLQIETGRARRITADEAIEVLRLSEAAGLVHNISNVGKGISTICNCCTHACGAMKSLQLGARNAVEVSRFTVEWDHAVCTLCGLCVDVCPVSALAFEADEIIVEKTQCVGCGLCVSRCPEGALHLELRSDQPRIFENGDKLSRKITREALWGLVKRKILGG
jgi:NAD-dependent dihydropyrimidine dehydrogenase PreA subunit/DNA-binding Lrp family transcriptional regulator